MIRGLSTFVGLAVLAAQNASALTVTLEQDSRKVSISATGSPYSQITPASFGADFDYENYSGTLYHHSTVPQAVDPQTYEFSYSGRSVSACDSYDYSLGCVGGYETSSIYLVTLNVDQDAYLNLSGVFSLDASVFPQNALAYHRVTITENGGSYFSFEEQSDNADLISFNETINLNAGNTYQLFIRTNFSEGDTYRYYAEADFGGTITTVPVPAAIWLFGSALAGLGWLRGKQAA